MSTQIFKNKIPNNLLFELFDKICLKNDKYYTFNNSAFKKGMYNSEIPKFIESCNHYYHLSKRKYLEKKLSNRTFTTILRQICNANDIKYTSHIIYCKSSYDIVYYIYF